MCNIERRHERRAPGIQITGRLLFIGMMPLQLAWPSPVAAQSTQPARSPVLLGDLYGQVQRANPRVAAARSLTRAAQARVAGASRPPDPNFQLGFMNYALPSLAPMPTLGMTQLQLMQMLPLGGKLGSA